MHAIILKNLLLPLSHILFLTCLVPVWKTLIVCTSYNKTLLQIWAQELQLELVVGRHWFITWTIIYWCLPWSAGAGNYTQSKTLELKPDTPMGGACVRDSFRAHSVCGCIFATRPSICLLLWRVKKSLCICPAQQSGNKIPTQRQHTRMHICHNCCKSVLSAQCVSENTGHLGSQSFEFLGILISTLPRILTFT